MRTAHLIGVALLIVACAQAVVGGDRGQETDEQAEQLARGELLYRIHCLNCHGANGKGEGPMAGILNVRPADLTKIKRRRGGDFPVEEILKVVDGRAEVLAHGAREMPVWGLSFRQSDRDSAQEEQVRARIEDLVFYLKTIQVPAD